jgi:hypothetical protein
VSELPLGQRESAELEFKGSDAIGDLAIIGRAAVALLNASGGTLWIGIEENEGIAVNAPGLTNAEPERRRILDYLVDSIEPPPTHEEIEAKLVAADEAGTRQAVRLCLAPQDGRRPYALVRRHARHYLKRFDARARYMTRAEIEEDFRRERQPKTDAVEELKDRLRARREELQRAGRSVLWLSVGTAAPLDLDLQDERYRHLFTNPAASNNRAAGWNAITPYREPALSADRLQQNGMTLWSNAWLELQFPIENLNWKGEENEIYPFAFIEYTVSMFRLAGVVYQDELEPEGALTRQAQILADLGLFRVSSWQLRPHSPRSIGYLRSGFDNEVVADAPLRRPGHPEVEDVLLHQPHPFYAHELIDEPDRCAFRIVREIYQAFGYTEDKIPAELDRTTGRLELGD